MDIYKKLNQHLLDKENIIEIDIWSEFRGIRNSISHDYPFEEKEKIEAINYLIMNVHYKVQEDLFRKKIRLKTVLEDVLYKPVDIVVSTDKERLIEKEARRGIVL